MPALAAHVGTTRQVSGLLSDMQRVKDADEIAQIEANVAGNDRAFGAVREAILPGMTEIDLRPYLIPAESTPLAEGMIVTIEPGIYIPGWGGMRLEGNYLIVPAGARRLDGFPRELTVC